jgi:hypothetical protein
MTNLRLRNEREFVLALQNGAALPNSPHSPRMRNRDERNLFAAENRSFIIARLYTCQWKRIQPKAGFTQSLW